MLKFCLILNYSNSRGVFRTQSSIYDGAFCENSWRLSAVHSFHKNLHLRYSTGLWIVSFPEYFASLNLSSLYCINKENSYEKRKNKQTLSRLQKFVKNSRQGFIKVQGALFFMLFCSSLFLKFWV